MKFLAGDVGGTKTALMLFDDDQMVRRATFPSARFASLELIVREFLGQELAGHAIAAACFGIAGPITEQSCRATNLPWVIEAYELERALQIPRVRLVNDFHALSIGITCLPASDFAPLNDAPAAPEGPWAVIGAGTGLGEAVLTKRRTGAGFDVLSSEGSHTDFGPRNELEVSLLRFLWKRHKRVSYERIASGMGLPMLYEFFLDQGIPETPAVREEMAREGAHHAAIVSAHGSIGDDEICVRALDLFVSVYGSAAGNLALTVLPRGGVYVAGGISPKILHKLKDGTFMAAFQSKGRLSHMLESMPVQVVLNADAGLIGAAAIARES
ncbi:MAG: glucokinase [Myxococcales bacterium]|jgi:glucokinase|nr:glucokinase [Myxococcales bacterium]